MDELDFDLAVLERRLHQARQNAVQAELAAAGLQEIGHPMLLCMLDLAGRRPEAPLRTQRELAQMLNVSPAAVTASLRSLERKGYLLRETGRGDARCNQVRLTDKGRQAVDAARVVLGLDGVVVRGEHLALGHARELPAKRLDERLERFGHDAFLS